MYFLRKSQYFDVVVHITRVQYLNTFIDLVSSLVLKNLHVAVICPSQITYFDCLGRENLKIFKVKNLNRSFRISNSLAGKFFLTTMPGLGTEGYQRSRKYERYAYVPHAESSVHFYREFAFDLFDIVFCPNSLFVDQVRMLERARKSMPKELVESGVPYYKSLRNSNPSEISQFVIDPRARCFVASSWGAASLLYSEQLLIPRSYKIYLKAHPQSLVSDKAQIKILKRMPWIKFTDVNIREISDLEIPFITDFSSVGFDYNLISSRPVYRCIDRSKLLSRHQKYEYPNVGIEPYEIGENISRSTDVEGFACFQSEIECSCAYLNKESAGYEIARFISTCF